MRSLVVCIVISCVFPAGGCGRSRSAVFEQAADELPAAKLAAAEHGIVLGRSAFNPTIPEGKNAALDYKRAFAKLDKSGVDVSNFVDESIRPGSIGAVKSTLDRLTPVFAELDRAAKKPRCSFGETLNTEDDAQYDLYRQHFTSTQKALCVRAFYAAMTGDESQAINSVRDMSALTNASQANSSLINDFLESALEAIELRQCGYLVSIRHGDPSFALRLLHAAEALKPSLDIAGTLRSEAATIYEELNPGKWQKAHPRGYPAPFQSLNRPYEIQRGLDPSIVAAAYRARALQMYVRLLDSLPKREACTPSDLERLGAAARAQQSSEVTHAANNVFSAFYVATGWYRRYQAAYAVNIEGLEILRKGKPYPNALPSGAPLDAFSGRRLEYVKTADGFRLWSVGDENGNLEGKPNSSLTFAYPRPLPKPR